MKSLVTLIAVIALAAPVFAQVDITCVDNGGGSITIGYANASADISGVSLIVTLTGGDATLAACTDAVAAAPFNANIDFFSTTGGTPVLGAGCPVGAVGVAGLPTFPAASFAVSTGVLMSPPAGAPMLPATGSPICTIQLTGTTDTTVTLSADVTRGGVVSAGVTPVPLVATFPAPKIVSFGPTCCRGDVADQFAQAGSNMIVDFGDINLIVGTIAPLGFTTTVVAHPELLCGDVADAFAQPAPVGSHGIIDFGDINLIVGTIAPLGFTTGCLP